MSSPAETFLVGQFFEEPFDFIDYTLYIVGKWGNYKKCLGA